MDATVVTSRRRVVNAGVMGTVAAVATAALPGLAAAGGEATARFAYVGTYTKNPPGGGSGRANPVGISAFRVAADTGALTLMQTVPSANPSFLALDPQQRTLYAINEINDYQGRNTGSIEAYAIDATTGMLTLLNRQDVGGPIPAHLLVDPSGRFVVVAIAAPSGSAVYGGLSFNGLQRPRFSFHANRRPASSALPHRVSAIVRPNESFSVKR